MTLPEAYVRLRQIVAELPHQGKLELAREALHALNIIEEHEIWQREENLMQKQEIESLKQTIAALRTPPVSEIERE